MVKMRKKAEAFGTLVSGPLSNMVRKRDGKCTLLGVWSLRRHWIQLYLECTVASADNSSTWKSYECYVSVMMNSPNVSTILPCLPSNYFMTHMPSWYTTMLEENKLQSTVKTARQRVASFLALWCFLAPFLTHVVLFVFPLYTWITAMNNCVMFALLLFFESLKDYPWNPRTLIKSAGTCCAQYFPVCIQVLYSQSYP